MCFYIGIEINRAGHIRLNKKEKHFNDFQLHLHQPLASGFEYPLWPVVKPIENGDDFTLEMMHWEFIPSYIKTADALLHFRKGGLHPQTGKKDFPHNTLNARGEDIFQRPTYKDAALHRRCLILSSGFYEWRHFTPDGGKDTAYPYYISLKNTEYFFMAGIFNPWLDQSTGEMVNSFSILTTAANPLMEKIHNKKKRMPVILSDGLASQWIQTDLSVNAIQSLATHQINEDEMTAHTIRKDFRQIEEPREQFDYTELPIL
ncbi:MAG: SOS response-associated peptidase [Bacteroidota bacterium]|jgi:putative SOS response-associated peptidase YedK